MRGEGEERGGGLTSREAMSCSCAWHRAVVRAQRASNALSIRGQWAGLRAGRGEDALDIGETVLLILFVQARSLWRRLGRSQRETGPTRPAVLLHSRAGVEGAVVSSSGSGSEGGMLLWSFFERASLPPHRSPRLGSSTTRPGSHCTTAR